MHIRFKGFTLIEILVVMTIIGILATMVVLSFDNIQEESRDSDRSTKISVIAEALEKYYDDNGSYPDCSSLSQDPEIVAESVLPGIHTDIFNTPSDDSGTNSIIDACGDLSSGNDSFAYVGDGSSECISGQYCKNFTLKYWDESSNTVISIESRRTAVPSVWTQISSGGAHTCAIGKDSLAYCWGANWTGQLGDNTIISKSVPTPVNTSGALSGLLIKSISAGAEHTCVLASNNKVYCWGEGEDGQLGNGSVTDRHTPYEVTDTGVLSGKSINLLGGSGYNSCVIASDYQAYCWGRGTSGQLGNNSNSNSSVPVAVDRSGILSDKRVEYIEVGDEHTCAIASDKKFYCWGMGSYGRIGDNSTSNRSVPTAVNTAGVLSGKTAVSVNASGHHSCAIASNGTSDLAYCWGQNTYGTLGNNSTTQSNVPVAVNIAGVLSGKTIKIISAGDIHSCAVASDNNAYCWGGNFEGELGNNSTTQSNVPVAVDKTGVLSDKTIKKLSVGFTHTCVIASDNNIYCWGDNYEGQLGDNTTIEKHVPVLAVSPF